MNAKYQEHLKAAEKIGFREIKTLKKAFRNLEKNERFISRKNGFDTMIHSFYVHPCGTEDPNSEFEYHIDSPFFMLKGSNHNERRDAVMNYIFAVGPEECYRIESKYFDIPVENTHIPIKMKKHRSKKWRNGKKK